MWLPGMFLVLEYSMKTDKPLPLNGNKVIAVGASAGSTLVIQDILSELPDNFKIPILIVLHITPGFIESMADWMGKATGKQICIAKNGDDILPGYVYFAPNGSNMGVTGLNQIILDDSAFPSRFKPSIAYLFRSTAQVYGKNAIGIMLSGMGTDGAKELLLMKEKGAITVAQDKESSIVYGMPGEAARLGAATHKLPPEQISMLLETLNLQYDQ